MKLYEVTMTMRVRTIAASALEAERAVLNHAYHLVEESDSETVAALVDSAPDDAEIAVPFIPDGLLAKDDPRRAWTVTQWLKATP